MKLDLVEQVANAVLYEGYNLYPYRPSSVKNRQRWTFGGVCPRAYGTAHPGEVWAIQTQCLVLGTYATALTVRARFLHLLHREVGELVASSFRHVDSLHVGDQLFQAWEEAVERDVEGSTLALASLAAQPHRLEFSFPAWRDLEQLRGADGEVAGVLLRQQQPIEGMLEIAAERIDNAPVGNLFKVTARVINLTPFDATEKDRDEAMLQSLVSTHLILGLDEGEFVSAIDPPEALREATTGCRNEGVWPVLVGEEPERDMMLASPIILYDYPEIAPESPGDLFDGTEIDEILTLRIMTLTEEERRAMRGTDERTRALLDRTDALPAEQLAKLHGALRGLRTAGGLRTEDLSGVRCDAPSRLGEG